MTSPWRGAGKTECQKVCSQTLWLLLAIAAVPGLPTAAQARNLEPGRLFLGAGVGGGARLPTALGASAAAGQLVLTGEYTLHRAYGVVADVALGMAHTNTVIGAAGMRGRLVDLGLALSPYAQVELAAGGLFDVLGARVPWLGSRIGLGVDYFLTGQTHASVMAAALVGGTLKEHGAFYGTVQLLISLHFGARSAARPIPSPLPVLGA